MADCGASGSALDQAARAMLGGANAASTNGGQTAQKQFGNLLGHAALSGGASVQNAMPVARPDHISLNHQYGGGGDSLLAMAPSSQQPPQAMIMSQSAHQNPLDAAWQQQPQGPNHPHPMMNHQHPHHRHQQQHHQQQQQMAMYQQQQHHQMMMMQQQQQRMMAIQAQQQQQQQQQLINQKAQGQQIKSKQSAAEEKQAAENNLENWHEGLEDQVQDILQGHEGNVKGASIEDLAAAWAEAQAQAENNNGDSKLGHEGDVQGASVEDLAAAWNEAQNEYYQQELDSSTDDDPSTWWAADGEANANNIVGEQHHPLPYQFVHKVDDVQQADKNSIPSNANFMDEGMKQFREGNITEAIRNFELELQRNDPDHATAWLMLGRCHAENDQDREAITCLEHAVDRDPYSPESLLALGVSYVNELNHTKALANLKQWITNNPKYAGMDLDTGDDVYGDHASANPESSNHDSGFQEVQNLLLKALEFDSSDAADVWEALGVAANVSRDYETAVEAFNKAIEARPEDYQLWNKLGATLANGNQSEKALPAYFKALQLKPKYARAWLNMAISHSNLQDYDEAARCYLQTLSLNPAAVHCWSYLRVALSCSERWDLIPLAASQNLNEFQDHFDFVMYDK